LKNAIAVTTAGLEKESEQEVKDLWSKIENDPSIKSGRDGKSSHYSEEEIVKRKPSWFAGGFGHPDYAADFKYWGQMSSYSIDEAVALIVGVEPKFTPNELLEAWEHSSELDTFYPAIQFIIKQRKLLKNKFVENFYAGFSIQKEELKQWIDEIELDVDARFYNQLEKYHPNKSGKKRKLIMPIEGSIETFDIRERASMLKMIIAMAVDGYRYKIDSERSAIPTKIADALDQMGISLDLDTIRKYLKEGRDILPKDYKQE
jgi:hypothetical protein